MGNQEQERAAQMRRMTEPADPRINITPFFVGMLAESGVTLLLWPVDDAAGTMRIDVKADRQEVAVIDVERDGTAMLTFRPELGGITHHMTTPAALTYLLHQLA